MTHWLNYSMPPALLQSALNSIYRLRLFYIVCSAGFYGGFDGGDDRLLLLLLLFLPGLYYDVAVSKSGLELSLQGYGHKLPTLTEKIVEETQRLGQSEQTVEGLEQLFDRMKEKSLRSLKNYLFWQPYYHCIVGSLLCLEDPRYTSAEKHQALSAATFADFKTFAAQLVRNFKAQVLVHGNITAEETLRLTAMVRARLPFSALPSGQQPSRRVVQLSADQEVILRQHACRNNPEEPNSAIENVYVVGLSAGAGVGGGDRGGDGQSPPSLPTSALESVRVEAQLELLMHMVSRKNLSPVSRLHGLGL